MNIQKVLTWALENNHAVSGADFVANKKAITEAYLKAHPGKGKAKRARAKYRVRMMELRSPDGELLKRLSDSDLSTVTASSRGWEKSGPVMTAVLLGAAFVPDFEGEGPAPEPVELPDDTIVVFERESRRESLGSHSDIFGKPKVFEVTVEQYATSLGTCRSALSDDD